MAKELALEENRLGRCTAGECAFSSALRAVVPAEPAGAVQGRADASTRTGALDDSGRCSYALPDVCWR